MADTRGTFRLKNVRQDILNDEYVPISDVWLANNGFGYSMWANTNTLKKTNVNTGLASNGPTYPGGNGFSNKKSCVSTPSIGYWMSGSYPGSSKVNKLTYSTETLSASVPNTSHNTSVTASISAGTKAYQFNGTWDGSSSNETMKMIYDTETWSNIPSTCPSNQWYQTGCNSGSETGYCHGGPSPATPFTPSKMTFASDTWSTVPSSGFDKRNYGSGKQRTPAHCWYSGGAENGAASSTTNKMTFASETWALAPGADLPFGVSDGASYPYNGAKGAYVGGYGAPGPANSQAFTLSFATDTYDATTMTANSTVFDQGENGINGGTSAAENVLNGKIGSDPGVDGSNRWFDDATESPNTSYILYGSPLGGDTYKLNLSTETGADTPSAQMPTSRSKLAGTGNKTQGYFSSGYNSGSSPYVVSNTDKLTYSNDTCSRLPGSNIPGINGLQYHTAISSETDGYFWAGLKEYPTVYNWTKIYKITYSTDVMSTNPSDMTGSGNYRGASTNSATAGYETGGATLGNNAIKYTFSTETAEAKSGFLTDVSQPRVYCSATGNQTAGYWAGGSNYSRVAKVTWATETAEWTEGNLEDGGLQRMNATSNTEKGYWIGGYPTPSGKTSVTTFATDTHARNPSIESLSPAFTSNNDLIRASVGGRQSGIPVTLAPEETPTSSTSSVLNPAVSVSGYWSGGTYDDSPSPDRARSTTEKVTFATDTTARVPAANAPQDIYSATGSSSTTKGYTSGGIIEHNGPSTNDINTLTYSNDTWANLPSRLTNSVARMYTVNNTTHSYSGGGRNFPSSPMHSTIDKLTFATETANKDIAVLTSNRYFGAAVGSSTAGYFCGGKISTSWSDNKITSVDKLTYSSDSLAESPSLTVIGIDTPYGYGQSEQWSFGTNTAGYVCGGSNERNNGQSNKVNKITYATDTRTLAPDLLNPVYRNSACSSNLAGYYSGGRTWANTLLNVGYKMPFSSETWIVGPSLPLSSARYHCSSFSAAMNGNGMTSSPNVI